MGQCVILTGLVGDGELGVLVDAAGPSEAPQGEAGGRRRAGRMGRGQRRRVQLHPRRSDARHGLAQECMYAFLCTLFFYKGQIGLFLRFIFDIMVVAVV